jgi:hypothetical protein
MSPSIILISGKFFFANFRTLGSISTQVKSFPLAKTGARGMLISKIFDSLWLSVFKILIELFLIIQIIN